MATVVRLLRALAHRAGTSVVVLLVALAATAAATIGPTYYAAAQQSILQDTLRGGDTLGRGFLAVQQGPVAGTAHAFTAAVDTAVGDALRGPAAVRRLLGPPTVALETNAFFAHPSVNVPVVARTDVCGHLHFVTGQCADRANDVVVSASMRRLVGWDVGTVLHAAGRPPLRVVGVYTVPDIGADYWFARSGVYFPIEHPTADVDPYDAMFTPATTIEQFRKQPQGTLVESRLLVVDRVTPADVPMLRTLSRRLTLSAQFQAELISLISTIDSTAGTVQDSWSALAVPVLVVTIELLVLAWLLLFLVVIDAVEARGPEVALAKLRGFGAGRSLVFALSEPVALLAIALPLGAVLGWGLTHALAAALLRSGTPVGLPALGWGAATVAALGGVAAVGVAARGTLRRPVVEQWRRTGRRAAERGWVLDAVVVTAALAGLAQLALTHRLASSRQSALALVVPALLGLALAVVGSRALPLLCRRQFARSRKGGSLGRFLALRHIARRPGGTRTTMILGTAVALATFAIAAWSTAAGNRQRVAALTVGAPAVIDVTPLPGTDLAAVVDRLDPSGRRLAAVQTYSGTGSTTLAVQPQRFAAVANWTAAGVPSPVSALGRLHPPAPPALVLDGAQVRLRVTPSRLSPPAGLRLVLTVFARGGGAPTPVDLGPLPAAGSSQRLVGELSGCPCFVQSLGVSGATGELTGAFAVSQLQTSDAGGWRNVAGGLDAARWTDVSDPGAAVTAAGDAGLRWRFTAPPPAAPVLSHYDRPAALPAVVSAALPGDRLDVSGLDQGLLTVAATGRVPLVPGAGTSGVIVDLDYAQRAAADNTAAADSHVWVRGDPQPVAAALRDAGVPVAGVRTAAAVAAELSRQGPALAGVLFLADASAAAALAALAAVLSLTASARRRRYEYAALAATGASRRTLFGALAGEQLVVVGFGLLLGVVGGLAAVGIAGASVPEFLTPPPRALLHQLPSPLVLLATIGAAAVVVLGTAMAAAAVLLRGVSADQLREAPL